MNYEIRLWNQQLSAIRNNNNNSNHYKYIIIIAIIITTNSLSSLFEHFFVDQYTNHKRVLVYMNWYPKFIVILFGISYFVQWAYSFPQLQFSNKLHLNFEHNEI